MNNLTTSRFIHDLYDLKFNDSDYRKAKECLLDYLGVTFAGAEILKEKNKRLLQQLGGNSQDSALVIGQELKTTAVQAALLNGMSAHVAELDDGDRFGMFHPGAPIISALISVYEKNKFSGTQFLEGIIIGYEASIRIARAIQPSLKDKGFHGTGIAGSIGAAVAVAKALDFSESEMKAAFSTACTNASGILRVIKDGSELKPFNSGNAASNGIVAAFIAKAGFNGPGDVLEGNLGFLEMFDKNYDTGYFSFSPSEQLYVHKIYLKPYAACRHCHPAIEAAFYIRNNYDVDYTQIKKIEVETYFWGVDGHDHTEIKGIGSAKMSTPYSVAVAYITGKAGLAEFSNPLLENNEVRKLTNKVSVRSTEDLSKLVPEKRVAIVTVITESGKEFTHRVELPKGEPENPMSREELESKFMMLGEFSGRSEDELQRIYDSIENLETGLSDFMELI